ncbi:MAG: hypothetical protein JRH20_19080 [Deltaproteobacteria bacterium]|nr:hypothetical protein [Deltaproteobacteria bacterium]
MSVLNSERPALEPNVTFVWDVGSRRSLKRLFRPPREADNPAHRLEFAWQNGLAMMILGMVGVLYATACCAALLVDAGGTFAEAKAFGALMGLSGLSVLILAQRAWGRRHARWLVATLLIALSLTVAVGYHDASHDSGAHIAAQIPLLLVLTVALMVYRPLQALLLAVAVTVATLTGTILSYNSLTSPLDHGALALGIYLSLLSLGGALFAALLYRLRWGIVDRRLGQIQQHDYFKQRTTQLEHQNEHLRWQRSHVVHTAESSRLKSLSGLAAGVAHEVNNPLGSLVANVDVLERVATNLEECKEGCPALAGNRKAMRSLRVMGQTLPTMREATRRVSRVVESLESFARLDRAPHVPVDLREGLESALKLLAFRFGESIAAERKFDEIPLVVGDAERLNQAFMNVLSNAVRAIDGPGTVTISTLHEGEEVLVRISDTGRGIAPEHLPHIFEPGFTTRGAGVGVGLGLAIAYRAVEDHGGRIEVESEQGVGTEVTLRLPMAGAE